MKERFQLPYMTLFGCVVLSQRRELGGFLRELAQAGWRVEADHQTEPCFGCVQHPELHSLPAPPRGIVHTIYDTETGKPVQDSCLSPPPAATGSGSSSK